MTCPDRKIQPWNCPNGKKTSQEIQPFEEADTTIIEEFIECGCSYSTCRCTFIPKLTGRHQASVTGESSYKSKSSSVRRRLSFMITEIEIYTANRERGNCTFLTERGLATSTRTHDVLENTLQSQPLVLVDWSDWFERMVARNDIPVFSPSAVRGRVIIAIGIPSIQTKDFADALTMEIVWHISLAQSSCWSALAWRFADILPVPISKTLNIGEIFMIMMRLTYTDIVSINGEMRTYPIFSF